jgi:hypothetical protein
LPARRHAVRAVALAVALLAGGCAAPGAGDAPSARAAVASFPEIAPARFGPARPTPPQRSNGEMARDFLDLSFRMESGRPIEVFTRFEKPVTVRMTGPVPALAAGDLDRLLARLRGEAGIDITRTDRADAVITVEFLPRRTMRAIVPQAACFVAPNVSSWREYRAYRRTARVDWVELTDRQGAAVFIPSDTSAQEVRDCLHEEIAQALGPLNDLYRLPDSVFNDDNIHGILTGFDMLMLRTTYAPELQNGMRPESVAALVPAILDRLNPRGRGGAGVISDTPRAYVSAIETALGPRASPAERRSAAARATGIAEEMGWRDVRAGFAWFLRGRLALASDLADAQTGLMRAQAIYGRSAVSGLHAAHLDMHLAAFALSQGNAEEVILRTDRAMDAAAGAENAALLATLLLLKAEGLELMGQPDKAETVRRSSYGWAAYGIGKGEDIRRRVDEIGALSPRRSRSLP